MPRVKALLWLTFSMSWVSSCLTCLVPYVPSCLTCSASCVSSRLSIALSVPHASYFSHFICQFQFLCTAWKVSKHGFFSAPNTCKYGPEKTPYLGTFHAVVLLCSHTSRNVFLFISNSLAVLGNLLQFKNSMEVKIWSNSQY